MSNTVNVHIEGSEDVSAAVDKVIRKLKKLKGKNLKIDIDSTSAKKKIDELDRKIKELGGTQHIKVDTATARDKIRYLKSRIEDLGDITPNIDVNTRSARDKIRYLINRIKEIGLIDPKVNLDTKSALAEIAALKAALKSLSGETIEINADKKIKVSVDKNAFERDAISVINGLNKPSNRQSIKIDVDESHLNSSLQRALRALGRADVRQKVKLEIDDDVLENSLKRALIRLGKKEVRQKIKIEVDQDNFDRSVTQALSRLSKEEYRKKIKISIDDKALDQSLKRALSKLSKEDAESGYIRKKVKIDIDEDHLGRSLTRALRGISTLNERRSVKVNVDVEGSEELLPMLAAISRIRNKTVVIRVVTIGNSDLDRIAASFVDIDQGARRASRGIDEGNRSLHDMRRLIGRVPGQNRRGFLSQLISGGIGEALASGMNVAANASQALTNSLAGMTNRIPVLGGMFRGFAALGGAGGPVTALVGGVLAAGAALTALGTIGVIGTGAITAGAYASQVALGAVAAAAGAVTGALGAGIAGGFAYLSMKAVPEAQKSFDNFTESVKKTMLEVSKNTAPGTISFFDSLKSSFSSMEPSLERIATGAGRLLTTLGPKMTPIADALALSLEKIFISGEKHLVTFANRLPDIIAGLGDMFETLGSPEMINATDKVLGALPGIITGIGDAINWSASSFTKISDFLNSENLTPLRDGLSAFKDNFKSTDWSAATEGIARAMNAFGDFSKSVNTDDISGTIGSISDSLANLANVAENINLVGIFRGIAQGLELGTSVIDEMVSKVKSMIDPTLAIFDWYDKNVINPTKTPKSEINIEPTLEVDKIATALGKLKDKNYKIPVQPDFEGLAASGNWDSLVSQMANMTVPIGIIPQLDNRNSILSSLEGAKVAVEAIPELKNIGSLSEAIGKIKATFEAKPELANNADVQNLLSTMEGILKINPDFKGGMAEIAAYLESQEAILEVIPKLSDKSFMDDATNQINAIVNMYPELKNVDSIPALISGIEAKLGITPELSSPGALDAALEGLKTEMKINVEANPGASIQNVRTLMENQLAGLKARVDADPGDISRLQSSLAALDFLIKLRPELSNETSLEGALGTLEAVIKATPELGDTQSVMDAFSALRAIIKVGPEMDHAQLASLLSSLTGQKVQITSEITPPAIPDIKSPLGKLFFESKVNDPPTPMLPMLPTVPLNSKINPPDTSALSGLGLTVPVKPDLTTPTYTEQGVNPFDKLFKGRKIEVPVTPVPEPQGRVMPAPIGGPPKLPVKPDIPAQPFANTSAVDIPATPDFSASRVATDVIPPIDVQIIPKFDGAMAFGAIPPLDVQIIPKFDGAIGFGLINPIPVQIIPQFDGAIGFGMIPPIPVQVIPQFDGALGFGMIPPIPVQIIPQFDGALGFGLIPPLPVQIIPQFNMTGVMIPPIMVPVILQMPPAPSVNVTVTSNIADIAGQIAAIPGAVGTQHTVTSNVLEITNQVNSIPKDTATTHVVSSNVGSVLSEIMSLNGQNTSSTHTVNIVTNGSLPSSGGGTGIGGFAGFSGISAMVSPMSSMMGIASTGLEGAAGISSSFSYSPRSSNTSLLVVSNAVKSSVIGAWAELGYDTAVSWGKGLAEGARKVTAVAATAVTGVLSFVGNAMQSFADDFLSPLADVLNGVAEIKRAFDSLTPEDIEAINKAIDEFNKMEIRPRADMLSNVFSSIVAGAKGQLENIGKFDIDNLLSQPFSDVESFVQNVNNELTRIGDIPIGTIALGTLFKKPMDDARGFIQGVQSEIANLKNMKFGVIDIETILKKPAVDMQTFIRDISNQLSSVGAVSIETIMAKPLADLQLFIDGISNQFNMIRNTPQAEIVTKPIVDVQSFLANLGVPQIPVKVDPDKADVKNKIEDAAADAKVDVPKSDSIHTITTNIDQIIPQIDSLNGRNTTSTHTVNVVVGGVPGLPSIPGLGVAGVAMPLGITDDSGMMGITGDSGLDGASGVTGEFSFRRQSGGSSLLTISTIVKGAILNAWTGLGTQAGIQFAQGVANGLIGSQSAISTAVSNLSEVVLPGSVNSSGAYSAGKLMAISYADGVNSRIGDITTVGLELGKVALAGVSVSKKINEWGKPLSQSMFTFGKGIESLFNVIPKFGGLLTGGLIDIGTITGVPGLSQILSSVFGILPVVGKIFNGMIKEAGYFVQNLTNPYNGKGVITYNYYHYETTTNNFDGGLVGNPEEQARRVLDVLEQSPSTRRIRKVFGTE